MTIEKYIPERIARLRFEKSVSARQMSLDIGQNENYINSIENKKAFPSIEGLYYICEYLGISLSEFFDEGNKLPGRLQELNQELRGLTPSQIDIIFAMAKEMNGKK